MAGAQIVVVKIIGAARPHRPSGALAGTRLITVEGFTGGSQPLTGDERTKKPGNVSQQPGGARSKRAAFSL